MHIDPIGTVVFPLNAMVSGLPLIGWAKPVPVNTAELREHWRQKFMLIAAAGPASNLALAVIAATLLQEVTPASGGFGGEAAASSSLAPTLYLASFASTYCWPSSTWRRYRRSTVAMCSLDF